MFKVGVCGYYAQGIEDHGGQPVKTRSLITELVNALGSEKVRTVDTLNWKKNPLRLLYNCFNLTRKCENVIILPAANGVKIFVPMLLLFNVFFQRKLHYVVIGGWIDQLLEKNKRLAKKLKKFHGIYVETHSMEQRLKVKGFKNIYYMPNMKRLIPVDINQNFKRKSGTFKLCTFSRVVKEKGIEDAINAVIYANRKSLECTLDIYGQIDKGYKERFEKILESLPYYIRYKGVANSSASVEILKEYDMQLFPTKYKTEGVPGSIIDSYFSGVPVLASKWESFDDVVDNGKTGIGFEFNNHEDFLLKLEWCIKHPNEIYKMKSNCLNKAKEYTPEFVMSKFLRFL